MVYDNSQAPITQNIKSEEAKVPRSSFNMSRVVNTQGMIGALIPIDVLETLPNEDYNISYDTFIQSRNPLVTELRNGLKVYLHTYWCRNSDLWEGWNNFIDKGEDGTHVATVPKYYPAITTTSSTTTEVIKTDKARAQGDNTTVRVMSPLAYMGVPVHEYNKTLTNKNYSYTPVRSSTNADNVTINHWFGENTTNTNKWGITALPLFMYQKIYRDYYANQNILRKNKNWFPDNEKDFIIPYSAGSGASHDDDYINNYKGTVVNPTASIFDGESQYYVPGHNKLGTDLTPLMNCLYFRQFKGDYFNTASIFPNLIRGVLTDIPVSAELNWTEALDKYTETDSNQTIALTSGSKLTGGTLGSGYIRPTSSANTLLEKALNKVKVEVTGVTLGKLRKQAVLEKFMQRNATTDGSYAEIIKAQFGYRPSYHDAKPTYVGGTYCEIMNNTVTATTEGSNQMLGSKVSDQQSANNGYIGKFHSDDYGYLMTILSIVPDTYYDNQGLNTMWTRTSQDLQYYPLLNNLEPQPILNKELYISGDETYDEDVFGYANIFEDMKSRTNIITGFGQLGANAIADSSKFMKRHFVDSNKPSMNQSFLTLSPANVDMTPFSSVNEVPYDITVGCNIDKVSPMPYNPIPADLGIKY